jgi:tripartite ATP-independent transporter DctM subunit
LLTEQSIAKVLVSGIIPGIILSLLFAATIVILCKRNPAMGPPGPITALKEKLKVLPGLLEALILFLIIIGGLFAGWFTPTQAGTAGAAAALLIGLFHKEMRLRQILEGAKEALNVSCMILMLITGSVVFGHFLSLSTIPLLLTEWVSQLSVSPLVILIIVCVGYIVGGCFIDSLGLIVLTIPIIAPIMSQLGYDLIWFGVLTGLLAETGVITPPVGVNVFVVKGLAPDVPLEKIFIGIVPFLLAVFVAIGLLIAFPGLATFLPSLVNQ